MKSRLLAAWFFACVILVSCCYDESSGCAGGLLIVNPRECDAGADVDTQECDGGEDH